MMIRLANRNFLFQAVLGAFLLCMLLIPAGALAQADAAAHPAPRRFSRSIRQILVWSGAQEINILEPAGRLLVDGQDREDIDLKAIQTCFATNLSTAREHVTDVGLNVESRLDSLKLRSRLPEAWLAGLAGHIDFALKAPRPAPLALQTVTGDIMVRSMDGPLNARTVDGDVSCDTVKGPAVLTAVTGNVTVRNCPRVERIRTATGAVRLSLDAMETDTLHVSSLTGSVTFTPGPDLDATLLVYTGLGAIHTGDEQAGPARILKKIYGAGAVTIEIHTMTGSVTIEDENQTPDRHGRLKR